MTEMTTLMRLPKHGPVSFSEDKGRLVISLPFSKESDSLFHADAVGRPLIVEGEMAFYCTTGEPEFVLKQIESRDTWEGLVIGCAVGPETEHKFDLPGPLEITGQTKDQELSLYVRRRVAQRDLPCALCEEKVPKGDPFKWTQGRGSMHVACLKLAQGHQK